MQKICLDSWELIKNKHEELVTLYDKVLEMNCSTNKDKEAHSKFKVKLIKTIENKYAYNKSNLLLYYEEIT